VRSYRTISPLPLGASHPGRYIFCGTFRGFTSPRHYLASCPLEPGLSSPPVDRRGDRLADSHAPASVRCSPPGFNTLLPISFEGGSFRLRLNDCDTAARNLKSMGGKPNSRYRIQVPDRKTLTHPKIGASWEGYVIEEVLHAVRPDEAFFWATHQGAEIDLVLRVNGKMIGGRVQSALST